MVLARISKKFHGWCGTTDGCTDWNIDMKFWSEFLKTDNYQFYLTVRETLQEFRSKSCYNSNINFDKCLSEEVLILSIVKTTLCSCKNRHLNNILPMGNFNMHDTYAKSCLSSLTISKYYYMEWVYYILEGMKEKKPEDWRLDKMGNDDLSNTISGTQWKKNT